MKRPNKKMRGIEQDINDLLDEFHFDVENETDYLELINGSFYIIDKLKNMFKKMEEIYKEHLNE